MSISGKCDFGDTCAIFGEQEILDKYQVYVGRHDIVPLKIDSVKELVAYFPYLVGSMISEKDKGGVIHLSDRSYIDQEEENRMTYKLDELVRYYKKCKRKKQSFDKNKALSMISVMREPQEYQIELVDRVAQYGEKATVEGLHDDMHDHMRKEWYELMLDNGWDEITAYRWVYGWHRYLTRKKGW